MFTTVFSYTSWRNIDLNLSSHAHLIQVGRIYVRKHSERMSSVTWTAARDRSSQIVCYTMQQVYVARSSRYSRLVSMVNTLGLPTIFFTHSADLQCPDLAQLICPEDADTRAKPHNGSHWESNLSWLVVLSQGSTSSTLGSWELVEIWVVTSWHVHGLAILQMWNDFWHLLKRFTLARKKLFGMLTW